MGPYTGVQGSPQLRSRRAQGLLSQPSAQPRFSKKKGPARGKFRVLRAKDKARRLRRHMHPLL
jgi:hypothetical protein